MSEHITKAIESIKQTITAKETEIAELQKLVDALQKFACDVPPISAGRKLKAQKKGPDNLKVQKVRKNKSSKYYGVGFFKGKWRCAVWFEGRNISLGSFNDEVEAAKKVDEFRAGKGLPKRNFP